MSFRRIHDTLMVRLSNGEAPQQKSEVRLCEPVHYCWMYPIERQHRAIVEQSNPRVGRHQLNASIVKALLIGVLNMLTNPWRNFNIRRLEVRDDVDDIEVDIEQMTDKAEDVVSDMLAKGFILGKDALNRAKSFDEMPQLISTTSAKVASLDQKIGLRLQGTNKPDSPKGSIL
ncbi:hypothetical protein SASPL_108779 [Salvia splendens]|uniref:Uncharacterized protein n=1 Tax=Salvia splendens TaxID=180675 RepID=A0A8X9A6I1_SALSN|nr:hypothetical protein SASPL_108779 [Salvia splendens]